MKLRVTIFLASLLVMLPFMGDAYATDTFVDSFESGDLNSTNLDGFQWGKVGANTAVVTQDSNNGPVKIWENNNSIYEVQPSTYNSADGDGTTRNWSPKTGTKSFRFRYPAGVDSWAENRFDLGQAKKDVWIGYWIRVPTNWQGFLSSNKPVNKFLALWSDGYEAAGDGSTIWVSLLSASSSSANIAYTYSDGSYRGSNGYVGSKKLFDAGDSGRWMHMVYHFKVESNPGTSDGQIQTFRRWEGQSSYEVIHSANNLPIKIPANKSPNGLKVGYLMGWNSPGYAYETDWLIDDFTVSTTSLITSPNPPMNLMVK